MNKYAAAMEKVASKTEWDSQLPAPLATRATIATLAGAGSAGMLYQTGESHPGWLAAAAAIPASIALFGGKVPNPSQRKNIGDAAALGAVLGSIHPLTRPLYDNKVKFKGSRWAIGAGTGAALVGTGAYLINRASREAHGD